MLALKVTFFKKKVYSFSFLKKKKFSPHLSMYHHLSNWFIVIVSLLLCHYFIDYNVVIVFLDKVMNTQQSCVLICQNTAEKERRFVLDVDYNDDVALALAAC